MGQALASFRGEAAPGTWIYRIATNVALDRARSRGFQIQARAAQPNVFAVLSATPVIEGDIARREMSACVRDYTERTRRAPGSRIAEVLGISVEATKIRLHRARARLRQMLQQGCDFSRDERKVSRGSGGAFDRVAARLGVSASAATASAPTAPAARGCCG